MTVSAEIVASSISREGARIDTFVLEFPRIILSEFNTHRVFSRNTSSSRAIPVEFTNTLVIDNPAMPVMFGANQPGMQHSGEHNEPVFVPTRYANLVMNGIDPDEARKAATMPPEEAWAEFAAAAVNQSRQFSKAGYHKQVCNRLTEFVQHVRVIVTSTSYDNWFALRHHEDADPTIHALANCMLAAYKDATPRKLLPGEWHTPFYSDGYWSEVDNWVDSNGYTLEEALTISASVCAQSSYRKADGTLEKARDIYGKLILSAPVHASPVEHQATPIDYEVIGDDVDWPEGITHMDRTGCYWSGNFKDWIQHRQLIANHVCNEFDYS
jgi:hypothetical protein